MQFIVKSYVFCFDCYNNKPFSLQINYQVILDYYMKSINYNIKSDYIGSFLNTKFHVSDGVLVGFGTTFIVLH